MPARSAMALVVVPFMSPVSLNAIRAARRMERRLTSALRRRRGCSVVAPAALDRPPEVVLVELPVLLRDPLGTALSLARTNAPCERSERTFTNHRPSPSAGDVWCAGGRGPATQQGDREADGRRGRRLVGSDPERQRRRGPEL